MYITCEQCSTIFRLDENLLKPTGSKVRCSQCRHVFMASPPEPEPVIEAQSGAAAAAFGQEDQQPVTFDQELEGIDLAELDSILENESALEGGGELDDIAEEPDAEEVVEFNEADLDFDFESALEGDFDDAPEQAAGQAPSVEASKAAPVSADDELDLDMDFELDAGDEDIADEPVETQAAAGEDELDLDMDFELDEELQELAEADLPDDDFSPEEDELSEDVELALDDFEEALGGGSGADEDVPLAAAAADDAAEAPEAAGGSDDLDLGDIDSLLDGVDEELPAEDTADEDVELSLSDDDELDAALADEPETVAEAPAEAVETDGGIDDLDLTGGLDDLLDDDGLDDETEEPEDVELSLDDDLELELDDASEIDIDESGTAAATEQGGDDLDLGDLDDLLGGDEATETDSSDEALSLDDELDLDLSEETEPDADDLSLDDELDLDLSEETEPDADDLSLDDALDLDLSEEAEIETDDLSLDDELDLDLSEDAGPDADELSLEEDLELEFDDEPQPAAAPEVDRDEFDLSDFESLLTGADAPADNSLSDKQADDFEFSDLDGLLDESDASEAPQGEDADLEMADDLELSLDMDDDVPGAEQELLSGEDDFDLSMLETSSLDDEEDESTDLSLDDDMELVLDDEVEDSAGAGDAADADLGDIEDLDFELDAEFEDKPIFQAENTEKDEGIVLEESAVEAEADEEIDLSDIEKMLEDDSIVPDVEDTKDGGEPGLSGDGAEKWADELGDDLGFGGGDEIDLTELEDAVNLADSEGTDVDFADGEDELDLDLDLEPEAVDTSDEPEPLDLELDLEQDAPEEQGADEELDLSDIPLTLEEEKPTVQSETVDGGDIQLEFQVDTADPDDFKLDGAETVDADRTTAASAETTGFTLDDETFSGEDTITNELVGEVTEATAPPKAPKKKKRGAGKFLVILLVLACLGGGGFYGYEYVVKNNIHIPYLSDYINPEAKDPTGIMKLSTSDINGKFIENEVAGRLFAVTGKVRNGYKVPRKLIRLRGKLYIKNDAVAKKTEHTYAGLIVADQELSSKAMADIKKQLNNTMGQDAAITVAPGQTVSFMVIFADLPADLDTYDIELVSSIKAQ